MILRCSIGLCILFHLILLCQGHHQGNDGIGFGFPESEEDNPNKQNSLHKQPVLVPSRCKDGELYYPGDQGDDWVCDCRPGYVYYPLKGLCYAAYKRGPCPPYHYLVLPPSSVIPICKRNPCNTDNFVRFHGKCHELGKAGPCPVPEISNRVGINETTLEIICTKGFSREEILKLNNRNNFPTEAMSNSTEPPTQYTTEQPSAYPTDGIEVIIQANEPIEYYNTTECFPGGKRYAQHKQRLDEVFGSWKPSDQ